jgi:hypothetical protein
VRLRVLFTAPLAGLLLTTMLVAAAEAPKTRKETREDIGYVQQCLRWFGFEPGAADGSLSRHTLEALAAYAQSREWDYQPDAVALRGRVALECTITGAVLTSPETFPQFSEDNKAIRKIQYCLTRLGRYRRAINGQMEPALHQAMEQYRRDKGITSTDAGWGTAGQVLRLECQPYLSDFPSRTRR